MRNKLFSMLTILTTLLLLLLLLDRMNLVFFLIAYIPLSLIMLLIGVQELRKVLKK